MKSLVSLITSCYNSEKHINNYVNNILRQTYETIQVIFVNDGSEDNSEKHILEKSYKIKRKNYEFIYIKQENKGVADAINSALLVATGTYIMLLDMDDILYPDAVKAKADFLNCNKDYGMVRNNGYYNFQKYPSRRWKFEYGKNHDQDNLFEKLLLVDAYTWPGSYMIRSNSFFAICPERKIYSSRYGQNMQFMIPMAYFYKTGFIDECLMEYSINENSLSHSTANEYTLDMINGYERNRKEIVNMLNISGDEKQQYIKEIEIKYLYDRLGFAIRINNRALFEQQYNLLYLNHSLKLKARCLKFLYKFKYFWLFYKIYHHMVMIIKRSVI